MTPSDNSFTISPHNLALLHSTLLHSYPVPLNGGVGLTDAPKYPFPTRLDSAGKETRLENVRHSPKYIEWQLTDVSSGGVGLTDPTNCPIPN